MRERKVWLTIILLITTTALLVGWRYPQSKANSWDYKIVPVDSVTQGEEVLKEMDGKGWELIAVQPVRTQAVLVPKIQLVQKTPPPTFPSSKPQRFREMGEASKNQTASDQPEAMYFFRRAR